MRTAILAAASIVAGARTPLAAQDVRPRRDTISTTIVGPQQTAQVRITYGRPLAEGRHLLGDVVPFGAPWLLGAGSLTELRTLTSLQIGSLVVPAGRYALWAVPTPNGATLIVNRRTGAGAMSYDSTADVGRVRLATDSLTSPVDSFTIRFHHVQTGPDELGISVNSSGSRETLIMRSGIAVSLVISWDRFRWTVPLTAPDTLRHKP